jgi:serine/threonine protein phosphatase PrpC
MADPPLNFKDSFIEVNEDLSKTDIKSHTSGTTCVVLYVTGMDYWLAHTGDSRAVLAKEKNGKLQAFDLTQDHKPDLEVERKRILASGGFVKAANEEMPSARVYLDKECKRVGLAVSRSIGDFIVKGIGVSAEPEVNQFALDMNDKFIIMASDGVWEFLSSQVFLSLIQTTIFTIYLLLIVFCVQEAVDIVDRNLDSGSERACQVLIETAMARWQQEEGDYRDDVRDSFLLLIHPVSNSSLYIALQR